MATRTISLLGGAWSDIGAWVEGSVPTAADDVVATALSGNLTIDGVAGTPSVCRSANFTNYVGTLTHASAKQLDVGDAGGGSFILVAGMTYVPNSAAILNFVSTTTGNSITTAGKSLCPIIFNGIGGGWTFTDAFSSTRDVTVTNGAVTTASTFSNRSIILNSGSFTCGGTVTGSGTYTVAGGTLNCGSNTINGTGLTASSGTATIQNWNGTGAFSCSGATVNLGAGQFTSATVSAGTVTMTGAFVCTTGGLGVSGTGNFDATGQNLTLAASLSMSSSGLLKAANVTATTTISTTAGTTTITGNVAGTTWTLSGSTARTINMGSGTWTLSGTGNVINAGTTPTNITLNPQSSTIAITNTSATAKTPVMGGLTYNNMTISGAAAAGSVTISGNNTFNTLTFSPNSNIKLTSGTTQTVSSLIATGTSGNTIALASSTPASAATISKSSGIVSCDYIVMQDQTASGGASFFAGLNSTNVSGNTGWVFSDPGTGDAKVYLSGSFQAKPVKAWDGATFTTYPLKYWNGSSWITTTY